jgi:hypothetical protein
MTLGLLWLPRIALGPNTDMRVTKSDVYWCLESLFEADRLNSHSLLLLYCSNLDIRRPIEISDML